MSLTCITPRLFGIQIEWQNSVTVISTHHKCLSMGLEQFLIKGWSCPNLPNSTKPTKFNKLGIFIEYKLNVWKCLFGYISYRNLNLWKNGFSWQWSWFRIHLKYSNPSFTLRPNLWHQLRTSSTDIHSWVALTIYCCSLSLCGSDSLH